MGVLDDSQMAMHMHHNQFVNPETSAMGAILFDAALAANANASSSSSSSHSDRDSVSDRKQKKRKRDE